ncbi:MAG TPA: hypothetical protein VNS88_17510 [Nitrospiraceae bacterium]|nr:hypothetical protein [Nitrospiraceae bacterium]
MTPPSMTRIPRLFGIWGTLGYGIAAATSITTVLVMGVFDWTPPWYLLMSAFLYVFISSGIIFLGRIEANKDAKEFIRTLRAKSKENKSYLN